MKGYFIRTHHVQTGYTNEIINEESNVSIRKNNEIILKDSILCDSFSIPETDLNPHSDYTFIKSNSKQEEINNQAKVISKITDDVFEKSREPIVKKSTKKERDFGKIAFVFALITIFLVALGILTFAFWFLPIILPEFIFLTTSISIVVSVVTGTIAFIYGLKALKKREMKVIDKRLKFSLIIGSIAVFTLIAFFIIGGFFS